MDADQAVTCPGCGHENPAGARFCNGCGIRLAAPALAAEPRAYTPHHLVEKVLAARDNVEGERKLVTVLFADVAGSMDLAERVDPEDWHRLLDRLFRVFAAGVHRYEGTINQYTGDGIMALFGAPIAHEDHAERACAAALDMARDVAALAADVRRESGLELAVRMGLNSGEVVVGRIGDDLRMDYTAQGHVVGLADRVQRLAPPGGVSLTERTARLVAGFFALRDRGEQTVKGSSVPIRVFDLLGRGPLASRLDRSLARGFSRFVGRGKEMARLEAALEDAARGRPRVVRITAEAGAGKSRLCRELAERSRGVAVHVARVPSHGRMLPFHAVGEVARSLLDVGGASPREVRGVVGRVLEETGGSDPVVRALWCELLGAPDPAAAASDLDPAARRDRLVASWCDVVLARARRETTLLWIEDLHWLDPPSEAAFERLAARLLAPDARGARVLLLATARPGEGPRWPPATEQIDLAPLGAEACRDLLDDWLGHDPALARLRERIAARARGNPLFVEEIVQSLAERGALRGTRGAYAPGAASDDLVLPESVQAVLASRIDRLAPRDKEVLGVAAVIGRDVPTELLRAVLEGPAADLEAALERLARAELLERRPEGAPPGVRESSAFRHPLTQEVAYRAQLQDGRRRIHGRVARALVALHGAAAPEHAPLVAHHFDEAGERLEAARWHERAGRRIARSDPDGGVRHCRRVAELVASLPDTPETLTLALTSRIALLEIGRIAGIDDGEAHELFESARDVAERLGDRSGHAFLLGSYGRLRGVAGDVARYLECAAQAAELAASSDDAALAFEMSTVLAHADLAVGRLDDARAVAAAALAELERHPSLRRALVRSTAPVLCRIWWAVASAYRGETEAARSALENLLADEEEGPLAALYGTHAFLCEVLRLAGDATGAVEHGRRAAALAHERGSPFSRVEAGVFLGAAALAANDVDTATVVLDGALELARSRRTALWYEPRLLASLAQARLAAGDRSGARGALDDASRLVEDRRGWRLAACDVELVRVRLLAAEDVPDGVALERALLAAEALVGELAVPPYAKALAAERRRAAARTAGRG